MSARDPHRFANELEETDVERLISRLESRSQDAVFSRLFDNYISRLNLSADSRLLEVGCGTGAILRYLGKRDDFRASAVGVDHCSHFIEAAQRFAQRENVSDKLAFQVGNAHKLDFPPSSFDVVIAHTLISHVTDPTVVLGEMAKVVRPGGVVVIFDGDYASLTYAYPDHGFGHKMDVALATTTFNNPRIMRDIPNLLPRLGLSLNEAWGDAVVEIGSGSYFKTFAETYVPHIKRAGMLPRQAVDVWLDGQREAMKNGTFFAACNYYTYVVSLA